MQIDEAIMTRLVAAVDRLLAAQPQSAGFEARAWLASWLARPCAALRGELPRDWLDTQERIQVVERLIGRMDGHSVA